MMNKLDNRTSLVKAAAKLTFRQGFGATSLADIAKEAKIPVGNIYYYFKTKEQIGDAIINYRLEQTRLLHAELERAKDPRDRLCGFVQMTFNSRDTLARGGCSIGTLCSELHKEKGPLAKQSSILFAEILAWMEGQFQTVVGRANSRSLAVHLLSALQGVSLLAHNFNDPELVVVETTRLQEWIRAL
jgi:TetR/AcrR family transcriptional regulator, transcriptional repressor for nem operon